MLQIDDNIRKKARDDLTIARTYLMMQAPFFGSLSARMRLVENSDWCATISTDGQNLYYNPYFIVGIDESDENYVGYIQLLLKKLPNITEQQLTEILDGCQTVHLNAMVCHLILHCAYSHLTRNMGRDSSLFHQACDYAVHDHIHSNPKLGRLKNSWLYDEEFHGLTAEEIYEILRKEQPPEDQEQEQNDDDSESDDDSDGENQGQGQGNGKGKKGGRGATSDQHETPTNPEDLEKNMNEFMTAMVNAAKQASDTPDDIRRMVQELHEPKINWREKIVHDFMSHIKNDMTYSNPNKRTWSIAQSFGNGSYYRTPLFPGLKPDVSIDIAVAIDASGSTTDEMQTDFLSEIKGISKNYPQFKIKIISFDSQVAAVKTYETGKETDIENFPIVGGGGTVFECVWEYMKKINYTPKQLVMFTDGEPWDSWGDPEYCETLFVIHSNPRIKAPFGDTVHYEFEQD